MIFLTPYQGFRFLILLGFVVGRTRAPAIIWRVTGNILSYYEPFGNKPKVLLILKRGNLWT